MMSLKVPETSLFPPISDAYTLSDLVTGNAEALTATILGSYQEAVMQHSDQDR